MALNESKSCFIGGEAGGVTLSQTREGFSVLTVYASKLENLEEMDIFRVWGRGQQAPKEKRSNYSRRN